MPSRLQLYDLEREVADADSQARLDARRRSRPVADALHLWMRQQRQKIPDGSATARAIDYSLNRWVALTRFLDDGELPIDNNWVENRIRPIALGRQNWLFAGSLRAGKRAAAVMSLIHSAKLNGLDPYAYMRDVLERLPTQPDSLIAELLPHHWRSTTSRRPDLSHPSSRWVRRTYMDAPGLPSFQLTAALRKRLHPYIRTFDARRARCP